MGGKTKGSGVMPPHKCEPGSCVNVTSVSGLCCRCHSASRSGWRGPNDDRLRAVAFVTDSRHQAQFVSAGVNNAEPPTCEIRNINLSVSVKGVAASLKFLERSSV